MVHANFRADILQFNIADLSDKFLSLEVRCGQWAVFILGRSQIDA